MNDSHESILSQNSEDVAALEQQGKTVMFAAINEEQLAIIIVSLSYAAKETSKVAVEKLQQHGIETITPSGFTAH